MPAPRPDDDRLRPAGWSGPWWMERQRELAGASGAGDAVRRNVRSVSWTAVGDLASPARLCVDPRGALAVDGATWSIDWLIGADDRWHVPAREPAVRQALVGDAPVVQTSVRVPSGDVHQHVAVIAGPEGSEAVVRITNDSAAPVALALVVRPVTLRGVGRVRTVELVGPALRVDGVDAVVLAERPRRALLTDGEGPDPVATVIAGGAPEAVDARRASPGGAACAVVVVPVAHRATWQFRVPLEATGAAVRRRLFGRTRDRPAPPGRVPRRDAPDAEAVARGWRAQVERLVRLDLPEDRVTAVLDAVRAHLLLAAGARPLGSPGAEVAVAAATAGYGSADGSALLEDASGGDTESAGASLWAAGRLAELGGPAPSGAVLAAVTERLVRRRRGAPAPPPSPWVLAGLTAAAALLHAAGEADAATRVEAWADAARGDVAAAGDASFLAAILGAGGVAPPPSQLLAAGPAAGTVDPARSLLWAAAALRAGQPDWYQRAGAVVALASPTATWPDLVDPSLGGGCGRDGDAPLVAARLWSLVRDALVGDRTATGPLLLPGWPPGWAGRPLEVHGLPTRWGIASYALRWHGERPALLWSFDGAPADLEVRAPALSAAWGAAGARGEALLPPLQRRSDTTDR